MLTDTVGGVFWLSATPLGEAVSWAGRALSCRSARDSASLSVCLSVCRGCSEGGLTAGRHHLHAPVPFRTQAGGQNRLR